MPFQTIFGRPPAQDAATEPPRKDPSVDLSEAFDYGAVTQDPSLDVAYGSNPQPAHRRANPGRQVQSAERRPTAQQDERDYPHRRRAPMRQPGLTVSDALEKIKTHAHR